LRTTPPWTGAAPFCAQEKMAEDEMFFLSRITHHSSLLLMKFSFRLLARIAFLLLVLSLLAVGGALAWFTSWRSDKIATLDTGSEMAKTRAGAVEFLTRGEGPPVLVFHGAPGGYDQAMLLGSGLLDAGFQIIAPSRPGYLRTPLATGLLPEQQADALAALLETLGLQSVAVLAGSAGAPAAIQFAVRHPQRVWALVLLSPVTKAFVPYAKIKGSEFGRVVLSGLTGDIGSWLAVEMAEKDPRKMLEWTLERTSAATQREIILNSVLQPGNRGQLEWFRSLIGTFAPLSPRESGARNDLIQMRALPELPLARISTPTLIVQGADDVCVLPAETEVAAAKIPNATVFSVPGAGHIVQIGPGADDVQKKITGFLKQHSGGNPQP